MHNAAGSDEAPAPAPTCPGCRRVQKSAGLKDDPPSLPRHCNCCFAAGGQYARGGVAALVWDVIADNQSYCETSSNYKYLTSLGRALGTPWLQKLDPVAIGTSELVCVSIIGSPFPHCVGA